MPHIDVELEKLKTKLLEMWDLVEYQLQSGREAMLLRMRARGSQEVSIPIRLR